MKTTLVFRSAIYFLVVSLLISGCGPKTGSIEGTVLFSGANPKTPVANAKVTLVNFDSGEKVGEAVTDQQGFYAFTDVEPGKYTWSVITDECATFNLVLQEENKISVRPGAVVKKDIDIACQ